MDPDVVWVDVKAAAETVLYRLVAEGKIRVSGPYDVHQWADNIAEAWRDRQATREEES